MPKRILITGSEGTLGKKLFAELEQRGHILFGADLVHTSRPNYARCDVSQYRQIERVAKDFGPDLVYHLAAEFGRVNGDHYYEQLWHTNTLGTRNVIEACLQAKAHLVLASSSEAYGDLADNTLLTEDLLEHQVPRFHNEYALTKWCNEKQVQIALPRGLQATVLRFFNAYGPGEHYSAYRSVVCLFIYRLMFGLPITVYKDYHRVFMYVDDWTRTVANVADRYLSLPNGTAFNIGGQEFTSVEILKDKILALLGGSTSPIEYVDKELANVTNKRPSNALAMQYLGHDPSTTLDSGLPRTIAWYKKVYR